MSGKTYYAFPLPNFKALPWCSIIIFNTALAETAPLLIVELNHSQAPLVFRNSILDFGNLVRVKPQDIFLLIIE